MLAARRQQTQTDTYRNRHPRDRPPASLKQTLSHHTDTQTHRHTDRQKQRRRNVDT